MTDKLAKTPQFADANKLDKRVPRDLLMKYQDKWYILKAGLEWKANLLFGGGNYGVQLDIVTNSTDYVLAKATLTTKAGVVFTNYGEASKANVTNPNMKKYFLHLALTRAECRVLRMATACGYTSVDEMDMGGEEPKQIPVAETDNEPPTAAQLKTIKKLGHKGDMPKTQAAAKQLISDLATPKEVHE